MTAYGQIPGKSRVIDAENGGVLFYFGFENVSDLLEIARDGSLLAKSRITPNRRPVLRVMNTEKFECLHDVYLYRDGTGASLESLRVTDHAFYDGAFRQARSLRLSWPGGNAPLLDFEAQLLDPKRVRARAAGIRLRRPTLDLQQ